MSKATCLRFLLRQAMAKLGQLFHFSKQRLAK